MFSDARLKLILAIAAIAIVVVFNIDPIAQDPAYHDFGDRRSLLRIPNFFNVLSNLPFVIVGILGIRRAVLNRDGAAELQNIYLAFFSGVLLTGFGSAYYHYHPDNDTLLWDRLPMTIAFMAFFCAVVADYISSSIALRLFVPLLLVGIVSVLYWHVTERHGNGDLRFYGLVQFLPVILLPLILWLYEDKHGNGWYYWGVIAAYAASKLAEFFDAGIYRHLEIFSGHTLKHLLAALGAFIFYCALRERKGRMDNSLDGL